jgi:hypothetical protein
LFFLASIEEFAIRGEGVVEAAWGAVRVEVEGEARTGSREPVLAVAAMGEDILARPVEAFPKAM